MTQSSVCSIDSSTSVALAPGAILDDRYEILGELRRTPLAVTFEARHRVTNRHVAVKIVAPDAPPALLPDLRARLAREAKALARVNDTSVLRVLDGGAGPYGPYIVTELPVGRTLAELLAERGCLRVTDAVSAASMAAAALELVHHAGIVHRAVSPRSLLVVRDRLGNEHLKLTDFGIAQARLPHTPKITRIASVVDEPAYTAVEQLLGYADLDARADVYSLGATLFECLTGRAPFSGDYTDVLFAAVDGSVRPVSQLCPDAGPALAEVVHRAMLVDRSKRFASMGEFRRALHDAVPWASTQTRLLPMQPQRTAVSDAPDNEILDRSTFSVR